MVSFVLFDSEKAPALIKNRVVNALIIRYNNFIEDIRNCLALFIIPKGVIHMKIFKSILSLILAVVLLTGILSVSAVTAYAEDAELSEAAADAELSGTGIIKETVYTSKDLREKLWENDTANVHEIILGQDIAATVGTQWDYSDTNYIAAWCRLGNGTKILNLNMHKLIMQSDYVAIYDGYDKGFAYLESKSNECLFSIPAGANLIVNGGNWNNTSGEICYNGLVLSKCEAIDQRDIFHVDGGNLTVNSGYFHPGSSYQHYRSSGGGFSSDVDYYMQINGSALTVNSGNLTVNGGIFEGRGVNAFTVYSGSSNLSKTHNGALEINSASSEVTIRGGRFCGVGSGSACWTNYPYSVKLNILAGQFTVERNDLVYSTTYQANIQNQYINAGVLGLPLMSNTYTALKTDKTRYYTMPYYSYTPANSNMNTFLYGTMLNFYVEPITRTPYLAGVEKQDNTEIRFFRSGIKIDKSVYSDEVWYTASDNYTIQVDPSTLYFPYFMDDLNADYTQGLTAKVSFRKYISEGSQPYVITEEPVTFTYNASAKRYEFSLKSIFSSSQLSALEQDQRYHVSFDFDESFVPYPLPDYHVTHTADIFLTVEKRNIITSIKISENPESFPVIGRNAAENPPKIYNVQGMCTLSSATWTTKASGSGQSGYKYFGGSFLESDTYYAYYWFKPMNNYAFADRVDVTFSDGYTTVGELYEDGELSVVGQGRKATDGNKYVKSASITLTEPAAGKTPSFTVKKDTAECDFYAGLGLLAYHNTGLEWLDLSKGELTSSPLTDLNLYMNVNEGDNETFKAGKSYVARVFLTTMDKTNTYFAKDFSVTINGKKATVSSTSSGKETMVWADYTFTVSNTTGKYMVGDADSDKDVTIFDATAIQRRLAELPVSNFNEKAADADEDGGLTIFDATAIQRYLAELPTEAKNIGKWKS